MKFRGPKKIAAMLSAAALAAAVAAYAGLRGAFAAYTLAMFFFAPEGIPRLASAWINFSCGALVAGSMVGAISLVDRDSDRTEGRRAVRFFKAAAIAVGIAIGVWLQRQTPGPHAAATSASGPRK